MEEQQSRLNTAKTNMEAIDAQNRFDELESMYNEISQLGKVMDLLCVRIFVPGRTISECDDNVREVITTLDRYKSGVCLYETEQDFLAIFLPQSKQRDSVYKKGSAAGSFRDAGRRQSFSFLQTDRPVRILLG